MAMALGLWLVALACGSDLGPVAVGHGLWLVAMASSRCPSLWPMADGLWLVDMACGWLPWHVDLVVETNNFGLVALGPFFGLFLLDQEADIFSNTLDAR